MATFGWIGGEQLPPAQWNLRRIGWTLLPWRNGWRAECRHALVCDTRTLSPSQRHALAESDRPAWRLILPGVENPSERAAPLSLGCTEALTADTGLQELEARLRRVAEMFGMLPRWRDVGPLTLDLLHRGAHNGNRWLGLHPREFSVLWRLVDVRESG